MAVSMHMPPGPVKVVEVVWVHACRGDGSKENPERWIDLYYSPEGELLACHDPLNGPPDAFHVRPSGGSAPLDEGGHLDGVAALHGDAPEQASDQKLAGAPLDMAPYYGDDYDRTGCRVEVYVRERGYGMAVFAPNGSRLETYAPAASPAAISRMLREWCEGKVPRIRSAADQPAANGS